MFYNKSYIKTEKLKCDHSFVFNEYYIEEYQRIIKSNYHVLGNFKNNLIQINRKKEIRIFYLYPNIAKIIKEILDL